MKTIRVDHVANYRPPKDSEDVDDVTKALREKGCGVQSPPRSSSESTEGNEVEVKKHKKGGLCANRRREENVQAHWRSPSLGVAGKGGGPERKM